MMPKIQLLNLTSNVHSQAQPSNASLEEWTKSLNLLRALPDPDRELYIQKLSKFTLFPKLHVEIRLMIWDLTFPNTTHFATTCWSIPSYRLGVPFSLRRYSPSTSQVNVESREETLKHYHVVKLGPEGRWPRWWHLSRPSRHTFTYFNPKTDAFWTTSFNIEAFKKEHLGFPFSPSWLNLLAAIKTLKITFDWWEGDPNFEIPLQENGLKAFTRLETLYVLDTSNPNITWLTRCRGSLARRVILRLTKVFEGLALSGVKCSVPKVVIMRRREGGAGSHDMRELTEQELLTDADDGH
jgi:hypothetical protein